MSFIKTLAKIILKRKVEERVMDIIADRPDTVNLSLKLYALIRNRKDLTDEQLVEELMKLFDEYRNLK